MKLTFEFSSFEEMARFCCEFVEGQNRRDAFVASRIKEPTSVSNPMGHPTTLPAFLKPSKDDLSRPESLIVFDQRIQNCLRAGGVKSIEDLLTRSEEELLTFQNFGRKHLNSVKEVLSAYGLLPRSMYWPSPMPHPVSGGPT